MFICPKCKSDNCGFSPKNKNIKLKSQSDYRNFINYGWGVDYNIIKCFDCNFKGLHKIFIKEINMKLTINQKNELKKKIKEILSEQFTVGAPFSIKPPDYLNKGFEKAISTRSQTWFTPNNLWLVLNSKLGRLLANDKLTKQEFCNLISNLIMKRYQYPEVKVLMNFILKYK